MTMPAPSNDELYKLILALRRRVRYLEELTESLRPQ